MNFFKNTGSKSKPSKGPLPAPAKKKPGAAEQQRNRAASFIAAHSGKWVTVHTRDGLLLDVLAGDPVGNRILKEGVFEADLSALVRHLVSPGDTFIDAGCNIGYFSCLAATQAPGARILALDANPEMIAVTRRNLAANGASAQLLHTAIGDTLGEAQLNLPASRPSMATLGSPSKDSSPADGEMLRVPLTTLDAVLANFGEDPITLLKMDLEGFDVRALLALNDNSAARIYNIVCEFDEKRLRQCGSCRSQLEGASWLTEYDFFAVGYAAAALQFDALADFPESCDTLWLRRRNCPKAGGSGR